MKSVLIGNGINIQFGGDAYSSALIMERLVAKALSKELDSLFDGTVDGSEITQLFAGMLKTANEILSGTFSFELADEDLRAAISDFQKRYEGKTLKKPHHIEIEDYFLLLHAWSLQHPDLASALNDVQIWLRWLLLDAIYNEGKLEHVFDQIQPAKVRKSLRRYLQSFDSIFTTNYDSNIDQASKLPVTHIHGDFRISRFSAHPGYMASSSSWFKKAERKLAGHDHCRCNALLHYSGKQKAKVIDACEWINKLSDQELAAALATIEDEKIKKAILVKLNHPELPFAPDYGFSKLADIHGEITIIGMSPNNDDHIFSILESNAKLDKVIYYYFKQEEASLIQKRYPNIPLEVRNVQELWRSLGCISSHSKHHPIKKLVPFGGTIRKKEWTKNPALG